MTDDITPEKKTAVQAVVDRISSWQDGATPDTVRAELDRGLQDAGVEIGETEKNLIVDRVADGGQGFDVSEVLR